MVPDPLAPELASEADSETADSETLASLAGQIESLLVEERFADAVQMARATTEMLHHVVSRAAETDPKLDELTGQLERIRHNLNTLGVAG